MSYETKSAFPQLKVEEKGQVVVDRSVSIGNAEIETLRVVVDRSGTEQFKDRNLRLLKAGASVRGISIPEGSWQVTAKSPARTLRYVILSGKQKRVVRLSDEEARGLEPFQK